jgi:alpha-galactosidase
MRWRRHTGSVMAVFLLGAATAQAQSAPPPNEPAVVSVSGSSVRISYNGVLIFDGRVSNPDVLARLTPSFDRHGSTVDQTVAFYAKRGAGPVVVSGTVSGSVEAIPAESDRPNRARPIVRHSVGLSRSRLNQSVYDRRWDWVLSVDDQPRTLTRVLPLTDTPTGRTFSFEARGSEIVLRFRPRFYQQHRGLTFFEPWTYQVWPKPVVGWSSWYAFFDAVTEQDIRRTADIMAEVLVPFGYEYLQIDDGYQRATGLPELWLKPNEKFPSGLETLASYITSKGLKPGLWTNATFSQTDYANQHKDQFVLDAAGNVARGNWIDHPVDASAPGVLDLLVRPIYRSLRSMGWEYYKLDSIRHLRYEGYNSYRDHFTKKGTDPTTVFRTYVQAVRNEVGRDHFLLACWGVRPELVGIADACRLGTDGYSYTGLAQYNSFNNIVWRNDPDHIELSNWEAWRSTMVTTLTGSLFMLTDKPELYRTPDVEPAKRTSPVLMTVPGQLYDVDPSRSSELARVDREVSGREPKPFDAGMTPAVDLFELEINRPFESWVVLGRTGTLEDTITFQDLGLDPQTPYVVFEFWEKRFLGSHTAAFAPGPQPAANALAFIIRERLEHPQILATSRHVTGGGPDLKTVAWDGSSLTGRSLLVGGDRYDVYVTEPRGWTLDSFSCGPVPALAVEHRGGHAKAGCTAPASGEVSWSARFVASSDR